MRSEILTQRVVHRLDLFSTSIYLVHLSDLCKPVVIAKLRLANKAVFPATRFVVPFEISVRPDIEARLLAVALRTIIRLTLIPVGVLHGIRNAS